MYKYYYIKPHSVLATVICVLNHSLNERPNQCVYIILNAVGGKGQFMPSKALHYEPSSHLRAQISITVFRAWWGERMTLMLT
jgi:hypothetical protein